MVGTLTIVARRPDGQVEDETVIDEQDEAITLVMDKLRVRKDKVNHRVMRASTVEDVRKCLITYKQAPDRLQMIGHGRPGALLLGAAWLDPSKPPPAKATYTLDSDPSAYGVLVQKIAAPTKQVLMLGCNVGDPAHQPWNVVDGAAFIFDLTRMWSVDVAGPRTTIDDTDFDDEGIFATSGELCLAHGLSVTLPPTPPMPVEGGGEPQVIQFVECIAAPALAHVSHETPGTVNGDPAMHALSQIKYASWPTRPLLAAPEIRFTAQWLAKQWIADVIGNGRFLRLRRSLAGPSSYFILPPAARVELDKLVKRLLRVTI